MTEPSKVSLTIGYSGNSCDVEIKREWALYVTRAPKSYDYHGTIRLHDSGEGHDSWVLIITEPVLLNTQLGRYASGLFTARPSDDYRPQDLAERLYEGFVKGMTKKEKA